MVVPVNKLVSRIFFNTWYYYWVVCTPVSGGDKGWGNTVKNLRAEITREKTEAFQGTMSLPFGPGARKQVAVKIVDDRGIESLKIIRL